MAPPGVTRGVSAANRSGADFAGADWDDAGGVESDGDHDGRVICLVGKAAGGAVDGTIYKGPSTAIA